MSRPVPYKNPVRPYYFADPFVLKMNGTYYAYGTAPPAEDGAHFPVLRSRDLAHWEYVRHALKPIVEPTTYNYWAPEVAEKEGRFFMYYSASTSQSDEDHRLRVAIADDPAGSFVDSGKILMPDAGFSIDANPFLDPRTGKRYLFFAADYTNEEPHGTGLAVVDLNDDMTTVAGVQRIVIRATCDWQIYERNRDYKGRVWEKWNCVEGPSVVYHDSQYFCLYSDGAWHSDNYGVGFAVADHPLGPWRDDFARHGPTVLKGIPGKVIGPGHNSIVLGPNDRSHFIVYHAWDPQHTARRMCIDPLDWTPQGPRCAGPTTALQTISV